LPSIESTRSNRLSDVPVLAATRAPMRAVCEIVAAEDLSVVFQPIIHMDDGRLFAYEALVRCAVPAYASPPDLFQRASESGSAGELGRIIREIAVPLSSGNPIFLNVHPDELMTGWLVRPDDPIFAHDHDVYLEITESVPLTHFELCRRAENRSCRNVCSEFSTLAALLVPAWALLPSWSSSELTAVGVAEEDVVDVEVVAALDVLVVVPDAAVVVVVLPLAFALEAP